MLQQKKKKCVVWFFQRLSRTILTNFEYIYTPNAYLSTPESIHDCFAVGSYPFKYEWKFKLEGNALWPRSSRGQDWTTFWFSYVEFTSGLWSFSIITLWPGTPQTWWSGYDQLVSNPIYSMQWSRYRVRTDVRTRIWAQSCVRWSWL